MEVGDEGNRYDESDEEEDECRVCRGPAEDGHPLFKPCICSGSIGLTHQDCLQSWLKVQRGDGSCELCKTKFRFAPKYAENAPDRLSAPQIISSLFRRAVARWLPLTLRSFFAASLWLLLAPIITAYLYHGWMARPSVILERMGSRKYIVTDLVSGGVIAVCIIVSFLSLMSFADFLRVEWQQRGLGAAAGPLQQNQRNNLDPILQPEAPHVDELNVDNGIWDHVQQQVLQQPANRIHNPRLRQLAARERNEFLWESDDEEDDDDDDDNEFDSVERDSNNDQVEEEFQVEDDDDSNDSSEDESWISDEERDDASSSDNEIDHYDDHDDDDTDDDHDEAMPRVAEQDIPFWRDAQLPVPNNNADDLLPADDPLAARRRIHNGPLPEPLPVVRPRQILRNNNNDARIDQPPPPFDLMQQLEQDEPVDMDINIALDELLGVRGPLLVLGRNLLWLLAFNAVYLGFFVFVPRTIGTAMGSILFNTTVFAAESPTAATGDANATESVAYVNVSEGLSLINVWNAIEAESVKHNTAFRLYDVATVALGYITLACAVVFLRFLWFLSQKVWFIKSAHGQTGNHVDVDEMRDALDAFDEMNRFVHALGNEVPQFGGGDELHGVSISTALGVALDAMTAVVKVGILLFLKMFLLPIVLGMALDASTMPLFGNSLEDRIANAGRDIFSFMLLHWVAGITFMLLVTVSVLQLREVAHPNLLAQMIRPQEPQPDLLGNLMHESVSTHSKRMFLSLIIYAFLLTIHVYIPVRYGLFSFIGERLKAQLHLRFFYIMTPQLQVPLELLLFHLCMLGLLEKYKNGLGGMQHHWLKFMTKSMGLSDRILPQRVGYFRLLGSRPVFQRGRKVDPFWYDIANSPKDAVATVQASLDSFDRFVVGENEFSTGETKQNGERVMRADADYIRLPVRLPGKALRSRSILLPTKIGKYRLLKPTTSKTKSNPVIQLWVELHGEPIARPPEGWDDLGAGGADIQGRWAWGSEKKSAIEVGVAVRRLFFEKDQGLWESLIVCFQLLALGIFSWLASSILLCFVAATPLVVGRSLYYILRVPDRWIHDPLAFGLGFIIVFPLVRKTAHAVMSSEIPLHQRVRLWVGRFHAPPANKAYVLMNTAVFWFGLAPLLLGLAYDLTFIKSADWFAGKEPFLDRNAILLSWMGGTVLLYAWADLCILGILTKNYRAFVFEGREVPANENPEAADWHDDGLGGREMTWQGRHGRMARFWDAGKSIIIGWEWDQVDEVLLLHDCVALIVIELFWALFFPLAALGVCFWRFPMLSGLARAVVVRSVLVLTCSIQVGRVWKDQLRRLLNAVHNTARDDRYLIGEILMNYGE